MAKHNGNRTMAMAQSLWHSGDGIVAMAYGNGIVETAQCKAMCRQWPIAAIVRCQWHNSKRTVAVAQ
ncbi:hypothetical protein HaLaN_27299 [Haematococcus lacustris]|uniref:Uncharacterized protein n=1 Tax=Haematococcus lacustris TaxID=44745 RepID=A0A6A0A9L9_HAELA|nr:hypothetical protein HaLaN_27299 [Haematococcus lacustris]